MALVTCALRVQLPFSVTVGAAGAALVAVPLAAVLLWFRPSTAIRL